MSSQYGLSLRLRVCGCGLPLRPLPCVQSLVRILLKRFAAMQFLLMVLLPLITIGQEDKNWPPLFYLRSDYRRVSVVAHVLVREAEIVNRIGGYEDWRVVGEVFESFKGKFHKGNTVEYYHGAEAGFRKDLFLGDKIVFLQRNFVEKEKRWVWAVLENSTLPYTLDRVQKLRIIKRAMLQQKSPRRKSKTAAAAGPFCASCRLHSISI